MNIDKLTQKSMEAIRDAQRIAGEFSNPQLEQAHLLLALLRQDGGLIPQLLQKMDMTPESLEAATLTEIKKLPQVSGSREADRF